MRKIFSIVFAVAMVVCLTLPDMAFAGVVKKRQVRQQSRICQGVSNGELTCRETARLEREQRHIQATKRKAWSEGKFTAKERVRLRYKQDRASRYIYRAKHN